VSPAWSLSAALNGVWMLACIPERSRFAHACRRVAKTQEQLLGQMLRGNRRTWFGMRHRFARIQSAAMYQRSVPTCTYDDVAPLIERIAAGERNVLTAEAVQLLEPTSGTTSGEKLIVYTAGLRRQFQRGVAAWIGDLFAKRPAVRCGRAYWSISPALGPPRRSSGGIPIGFAEDAEYLGWMAQFALHRLLVVPGAMAQVTDLTTFRYCSLLFLLAAEDLALMSVWNPTFLLALLTPLQTWRDRLCADLRRGAINPPGPSKPQDLPAELRSWLRPNPRRAALLEEIGQSGMAPAEQFKILWPHLALLSCWTDAAASQFLPSLREWFPTVEVQPKGLLATEAFVSFPLVGQPGPALAIRSHFFEFQEGDGQKIALAHQLDRGGRYGVVVTTAGGLYRYQLRDEVEVVGFFHQCPLLRFVGKSDMVSDLVGEKLAEPHVRSVLERLPTLIRLKPRFTLVVPVLGRPPRYRLYLQGASLDAVAPVLPALCKELQAGLEENPYYRHAFALGQLGAAEVGVLDPDGEPVWQVIERRALEQGRKTGDIKPAVLDRWPGWPERLAGMLRLCSGLPHGC
jgi:GH3 auxin-responsive promoter